VALRVRHNCAHVQLELVDPYSAHAQRTWRELARDATYFLSPGWVETWLACLPRDQAPRLAVFHDGAPIAACFIGRRAIVRRGVVPSHAAYLNATGVGRFDDVWIEYNGLVGRELPVGRLLELYPGSLDELFLPALREGAFGGLADGPLGDYQVKIERRVPAYIVELDKVRARGHLALLSGQTRSQLRRAQRRAGEASFEVARDAAEASTYLDELVALHTKQWQARGQPGAFAEPWFLSFHRRLVAERFRHGEIQLARFRTAEGTLACLYNFVWHGRVLQYQSGVAQLPDKHAKPGYIAHVAAAEHNARLGHAVYDLLGGAMQYKQSLATGASWLVWARVQRRLLRFALEDRLVALVRRARARL